jgi:hypothetical protein
MVTSALLCVQNGRILRWPQGIQTGSAGYLPIRIRALREAPELNEAQNGKLLSSLRTSDSRVGADVQISNFSGQPTSGLGRQYPFGIESESGR